MIANMDHVKVSVKGNSSAETSSASYDVNYKHADRDYSSARSASDSTYDSIEKALSSPPELDIPPAPRKSSSSSGAKERKSKPSKQSKKSRKKSKGGKK